MEHIEILTKTPYVIKHVEVIGLIGQVKEDQFYYCEYMIFNGLVFEF